MPRASSIHSGSRIATCPTATAAAQAQTSGQRQLLIGWPRMRPSMVAFTSEATNLAPGGNTFRDVFLKDMQTGSLVRMSTSLGGTDGNGNSDNARISADGRYIVFESDSNNLVAGDTNNYSDIFLFDRVGGTLISITAGFNTIPNAPANRPDIAHDAVAGIGPVVIFETDRTLVPADNQGHTDIYACVLTQ